MPIKRLRFHIHGTTPETCPMDRLLDYLKKLGLTMGSKEHVHLLDVTDGSLSPVIGVEEQEFPLVKARIGDAAKGLAQREANNAFKDLMDQLEEDQYKAELFDEEADEIIQDFSRLKEEETFGPFWQQGILYGYLRRLEGSDKTDHATLLYDGGQCVCEMSESIGHRLAPFYR